MGLITLLYRNPGAFVLLVIPLLYSIIIHELAHGWVADKMGDSTARWLGRLSLDPRKHLDPIGTLMLFIFGFGWAKPVPVNYSALRKPRQHMAWVAAAGPGANLLMALFWALALRASVSMTSRADAWLEIARQYGVSGLIDAVMGHGNGAAEFLIGVSAAGILVNLLLMLLNLLPILPLDGGRIVASLLPSRAAWRFAKLEPFGLPLLLLLLFVPVYGSNVLSLILSPLLFESEALVRAMVLL